MGQGGGRRGRGVAEEILLVSYQPLWNKRTVNIYLHFAGCKYKWILPIFSKMTKLLTYSNVFKHFHYMKYKAFDGETKNFLYTFSTGLFILLSVIKTSKQGFVKSMFFLQGLVPYPFYKFG